MSGTTDFDEWIDTIIDAEEYGQIHSLYNCISEGEGDGFWVLRRNKDKMFVNMFGNDFTLKLLSEDAITTFLNRLEERFCGELDIESWFGLQSAIDNDKS